LPADPQFYYELRSSDPGRLSPFRRALRFLHLNRYCFNGIFRTNLKGQFNVPSGGRRAGWIPPLTAFRQCANLLQRATLRSADFGEVLSATRKGDFVDADPPYAVRSRRIFREYGPREFAARDLSRLGRHLTTMNRRGVHFLVSYADCSEARELFAEWSPRRVRVRRHVAGFTGSRRIAFELLVTNIPAVETP
jgi:DNA adenine methylase